MKILWYTDTHFGLSGAFSRPSPSGYTTRLDETLDLHDWIAKQMRYYKPDLVIHGGDVYKPQVTLHGMEVSASSRGMGKIIRAMREANPKAQHITLLGNHDYISRDTKVTPIDWLNELPSSQVIKMIDFMEDGDDCLLIFCPYVWEYAHAIRKIKEYVRQGSYKRIYFFGHAEIKGALNSMVLDMGTGEKKKHYSTTASSIPVEFLSQFTAAFNGHHHVPQMPAGNVYITGSTQQFTVSEYSDEYQRGIYLLDTDTGGLTFIENRRTPGIVRVENNPEMLHALPSNNYVIYYYDPKKTDPDSIRPLLGKFKGHQIRPLGTAKFRPLVSVDFKAKDEDFAGLYQEYLQTVAFETKQMEKKVKQSGLEILKMAEKSK